MLVTRVCRLWKMATDILYILVGDSRWGQQNPSCRHFYALNKTIHKKQKQFFVKERMCILLLVVYVSDIRMGRPEAEIVHSLVTQSSRVTTQACILQFRKTEQNTHDCNRSIQSDNMIELVRHARPKARKLRGTAT
jgi:hypothetical protein